MGKGRGSLIGNYVMRDKVFEILRLSEQGLSKSAISRTVKVHCQTVREYLGKAKAAAVSSGTFKGLSDEEYQRYFCHGNLGRKRKKAAIDFAYVARELRRPGVTLIILWEEYLREHPTGCCYSQFCERYRRWSKSQPEQLSMRMVHKAGEKVFVDYSGQRVSIYDAKNSSQVRYEAEIFVGVLGASNYTYFEASRSQSLECWIGSHVRMLDYFAGVPEVVVPDNLKSGVTKADYFEPGINKTYHDFATHYGVAVIPARVRKPQDKAKVEKGVQVVQQRALALLRNRKFYSLAELNAALATLRESLNARCMKSYAASRKELFDSIDTPALKPLPATRYEFSRYKSAKVHVDYHVQVLHNYYSVPHQFVGSRVDVRYSEKTVTIYSQQGERIALHPVLDGKNQYSTTKEHMPARHRFMEQWSPMRFLEWAERIGPETKVQINSILLSRTVPEQSYRSCLAILSLAKKYSNYRLEVACKIANDFGATSARSIKNILENKTTPSTTERYQPVTHANLRRDADFH